MNVRKRDRLRYWFDNTMSRGTPALIGWLGLISIGLVLVVTVLVWLFARPDAEANGSFPGVLWMSLQRAIDPGGVDADEGSAPFVGLMLALTIGGLFVVSALIGVLTTGLDNKITELRKGRSRVIERHHTVILGWSEQIFTILPELMEANLSRKKPCIAILADMDKVEMEDEIRKRVPDMGNTRVVCRSGSPLNRPDLDLVSVATARSVIVLSPEVEDSDAELIKILLSLGSREWPESKPTIVASVADSANVVSAQLAGGPDALLVDADEISVRLLVQAHRQAGLCSVFTDLLDFAGNEFYMARQPDCVGLTFGEALAAFGAGTLVGLRRPDLSVVLNPAMNTRITAEDELIVLAEDDSMITQAAPAEVFEQAIAPPVQVPAAAESTLVVGWNRRAEDIVRLLDQWAPPGSLLHIGARHRNGADFSDRLDNMAVQFTECDPTDRKALEALTERGSRRIIVLSDDEFSPAHADSRTLVTLLNLRDIQRVRQVQFSIISEINDEANREVAQVTQADDFVVSNQLISLLLSQLSENPDLSRVFAALFDPEGSEIYLKPASLYVKPDLACNFATVVEAARRRSETAIGYHLAAQRQVPPAYGVVLNPSKAAPLTLSADDRVIVLAEGW